MNSGSLRSRNLAMMRSLVDGLGEYLAEAVPQDIARTRPLALAQRLNVDPEQLTDCCLHAVHEGLLLLHWDIICPTCRISAGIRDTLREIEDHAYCEVCDLDFELDFGQSLELIFRPHSEIREADLKTYCIGGPEHSPHVVAQMRLAPGERFEMDLALPAGEYLLRGSQLPYSVPLEVQAVHGVVRAELHLMPEFDSLRVPTFLAGRQVIGISNGHDRQLLVRVERTINRRNILTAAQVASRPVFRELFPEESLSPGRLLNVATVTLLVLDVANADLIYGSLGDVGAFAAFQQFHQTVDSNTKRHGGTLVNASIGLQIRVAFQKAVSAIMAARDIAKSMADSPINTRMEFRAGIHRGSALVSTFSDRLDYFGQTVSRAMHLTQLAESGEVVLSEDLSTDAEVSVFLQTNQIETVPLYSTSFARRIRFGSQGN